MATMRRFAYWLRSRSPWSARTVTVTAAILATLGTVIGLIIAHHHPLPLLTRGEVVAKGYDPPRDWIYMEPIPHTDCFEVGTSEDCMTSFTYIPIPEHDAEDWWVRIKACGDAAGMPN